MDNEAPATRTELVNDAHDAPTPPVHESTELAPPAHPGHAALLAVVGAVLTLVGALGISSCRSTGAPRPS